MLVQSANWLRNLVLQAAPRRSSDDESQHRHVGKMNSAAGPPSGRYRIRTRQPVGKPGMVGPLCVVHVCGFTSSIARGAHSPHVEISMHYGCSSPSQIGVSSANMTMPSPAFTSAAPESKSGDLRRPYRLTGHPDDAACSPRRYGSITLRFAFSLHGHMLHETVMAASPFARASSTSPANTCSTAT